MKTESGSYVPSSYKAGLYPNMERVNPILLLLISIPRSFSLSLSPSLVYVVSMGCVDFLNSAAAAAAAQVQGVEE